MDKNYAGFIKKHLGYTDEEMKVWLDKNFFFLTSKITIKIKINEF